jgi:hypothetical protein
MTPLRQRMIADLHRRGLAERPQELSGRAVRQLAEHKAPHLRTAEELRQYVLSLKHVNHYSRRARTIALCGLQFV